MHQPLRPAQCVHLLALLAAVVCAGFWCMDGITAPAETGFAVARETEGDGLPPVRRRVFVLLLDSLPHRVATDPTRMPHLVSLQSASTYGEMETVFDAVTVPALRAAFTGQDRISVFGFVKNLWHGAEGFSSMFTQVRAANLRTIVFSDGSFKQFGKDLPDQREAGNGSTEQSRSAEEAIDLFATGTYDLAIAHVTFTDRVAHVFGVHSARYREDYAIADDLVRRLSEAAPDDATIVVMGDHGHDDMGRHLQGMDVPTFALYRGPRFERGVDLGTMQIEDTRYLMSWALGLNLPDDYGAGRYPQALRATDAIPAAFAARSDTQESAAPRRWMNFVLVSIALALLVSIWVGLIRADADDGRTAVVLSVGAWLTITLLVSSAGTGPGTAAAIAVAAATVGVPMVRRGFARAELLWTLLPSVVVLALVPWGYVLSMSRASIAWPRHRTIVLLWVGIIVLAVALSIRLGAVRTVWALFGICGLLLYPTVFHYGMPATMMPLWMAMLIIIVVEEIRRERRAPSVEGKRARFALLVPITLLLLPFGLVFSTNFSFEQWFVPFVREVLWGRSDRAVHPAAIVVALVARLIVFVPWRGGAIAMIAGFAAALLIGVVQFKGTGLTPDEMPRWAYVAGIAACAVAAMATRRRDDGRWRGVSRVAWLSMLYLFYLYTVRLDVKFYLWADSLLGAFFLTGRFLATGVNGGQRVSIYVLLLLLAAMASTWVTSAWTCHRLEWGFLFDWLDVRFVERRVALFVLLIAARFCIPLVMARLLLSETIGEHCAYPQRWVTLVAGFKTFATVMVALGLGMQHTGGDAYLEAVQQTALWTAVVIALPWRSTREPHRLRACGG